MTTFWSLYVTVLSLGTIFALTWLLLSTRKGQRSEQTDETVGHSFDGIEEYDNPLPKWWFMLFVGTIVFALGYLVLYPGLGNWKGLLPGYSYLDNEKQTPFANGQSGWTGVHAVRTASPSTRARSTDVSASITSSATCARAADSVASKRAASTPTLRT